MERQTVLILDSQLHRGGILEQGLNSRGFNVFRTSRSREASKLLQVLQPDVMVLSWEGEGKDFYTQRVATGKTGSTKCVVITSAQPAELREGDAIVDMGLQAEKLVDAVAACVATLLQTSTRLPKPAAPTTPIAPLTPHATVPPRSRAVATPAPPARTPIPPTRTPAPASARVTPPPVRAGTRSSSNLAAATASNRKREWRGSLDKLDIARLFSILVRRQASGQLVLSHQEAIRSIWLHAGTLLFAEVNQPLLSFPEMLVQDGLIQPHHISQYPELSHPKPGQRLMELGLIQRNQIDTYDRLYSEQVVLSSFMLEVGAFQFTPSLDESGPGGSGIELPPLIIQGIREGYSSERLLSLLGGEDRIPQWFAHRSPENFLPLSAMEKRVLQQINGSHSLRQLCAELQVDPRVSYGLVYVLMILGFVTLQEPTGATPGRRTSTSQHAHLQGEFTPEVPMNSARSMFDATKSAPTPQAIPSLDPAAASASAPVRSPTASYRAMSPNRVPARPALRPTLDVSALGQESVSLPPQDPSTLNKISQKYTQVMVDDYFSILEVPINAGDMEIRRSYQRLKHMFSEQQFTSTMPQDSMLQLLEVRQTIQEAYDVLGDPTLREQYRRNLDMP